MNIFVKVMLLAFCLLLPLNLFAMKMDHDSMKMDGEKLSLGEVELEGVRAQAYLLDVGEAMAKHGMTTTHHLMVEFTDLKADKPLTKGRAAAKVSLDGGNESKAHKMMKMDGAFGTDLTLNQAGDYQFKVGTKFDGKKRTFEFEFKK